jgi:DNA-binding winged helix-turn-helix (wHTH) protein
MDQSNDIDFDGWSLNRNSGELQKANRSVRLRPQPQQILEELLAHAGEVVSREQLIGKLWPKGIVDFDTALNSAVRRLRKALCDDADTHKYIETIPRKGYRFIGSITPPSRCEPALVNAPDAATSTITTQHAAFSRRLQTAMAACALGAVGVWLAIDSHQPTNVATATARSIAATETVSKAEVFQFLEMQFARADSNHDGELDTAELAAFEQAVARPGSGRRSRVFN